MIESITLRNTEIKVSRLCMGGCPMGQYGWGEVQEKDLVDAVHAAIDGGITMFDTADTYGLGKAEETLAKALGNRRKDVVIATKFGVRIGNGKTYYDNSPAWIEEALLQSMRRLQTDYIDLFQIHYRDDITPIDDVIETLEAMKRRGDIRSYGLSNIYQKDLETLQLYAGMFASMQDEFSLASRQHEMDLTSVSDALALTPMTWGSLGQGILTGKYAANCTFATNDRRNREVYANFHGETLQKNMGIVEAMRPIAARHNVSMAAVALRFIIDYLPQSVVLVGAKNARQILESIEAMSGWVLALEELDALNVASLA